MFNSFQAVPELRPYEVLAANVDLAERNALHAWGGNLKLDFSREDAADDLLLNEVVWRSVRGADSPMPGPAAPPLCSPTRRMKMIDAVRSAEFCPLHGSLRPDAEEESRRDSGPKPRVARNELPWVGGGVGIQPRKGCGRFSAQ